MIVKSKDEAVAAAHQVLARCREMEVLAKKLNEDDMLGLECAETVQLEKLSSQNAAAARALADWIVKEHG
jgi:hypothetical protein